MLVGFLRDAGDDPRGLGPEFTGVQGAVVVVDLEQFAPICDRMKE